MKEEKKPTATYILSLETATTTCSVALHASGQLVGHFEHLLKHAHSRVLFSMVDALLHTANIKHKDLHGIAISEGPGSYTGLRIGTSFAKGISYGCRIPLFAINTLQTLAEAVANFPLPAKSLRYALLDARRGHVYGMLLDERGIVRDTHTCEVSADMVTTYQGTIIYCLGSGADTYAAPLVALPHVKIIPGIYPQARYMGKAAWQKFCQGQHVDTAGFSPHYLSAFANNLY